ncbi:YeeE/YedE thiosulfate transporter family protein [Desulfococcus sp.]|uniref:YeeE/YedE thiosulfate transporter family protein n=1 Tax=Desulfococcus sp. TaxID=2025834 RepID=UPI0035945CCB
MSTEQWLGLVTGVLFGFLLQKGRVLRFDKQVGAMLFRDMTIFKFMLSAILVGMVGILILSNLEMIKLSHKPMNVGAVLIGGALFGAGWAIMGFCPGTSLGALGEGRWHAVFAMIGMVGGAALYAEIYPFFKSTVIAWKDFGKIGLPEALGISQWIIVSLFWAGILAMFFWFEKKRL